MSTCAACVQNDRLASGRKLVFFYQSRKPRVTDVRIGIGVGITAWVMFKPGFRSGLRLYDAFRVRPCSVAIQLHETSILLQSIQSVSLLTNSSATILLLYESVDYYYAVDSTTRRQRLLASRL